MLKSTLCGKIVQKPWTDENGEPLVMCHQTGEDFTEFSLENELSGKFDNETPSGYFFKPSDADIGLRGNKQMALFLNIRDMKEGASEVHYLESRSKQQHQLKHPSGVTLREMLEVVKPSFKILEFYCNVLCDWTTRKDVEQVCA